MLFTVHDSVICNIQGAARSLEVARSAVEFGEETLAAPIPEMGGFKLRAEGKIGPSWGEGYLKHKLEGWFKNKETVLA